MTDFLNEVRADSARARGNRCKLGILRDKDPKLADAVDETVAAKLPYAAIGRQLKKRGHDIPNSTLQRHYSGECKCPTTS